MEVWCPEWAFVHRRGHFCGCGEKIATACPRRRCFLLKFGAGSGFCPQAGAGHFCGSLVPEVTFVHGQGRFVDAEGDLLNYFVIGKLNS